MSTDGEELHSSSLPSGGPTGKKQNGAKSSEAGRPQSGMRAAAKPPESVLAAFPRPSKPLAPIKAPGKPPAPPLSAKKAQSEEPDEESTEELDELEELDEEEPAAGAGEEAGDGPPDEDAPETDDEGSAEEAEAPEEAAARAKPTLPKPTLPKPAIPKPTLPKPPAGDAESEAPAAAAAEDAEVGPEEGPATAETEPPPQGQKIGSDSIEPPRMGRQDPRDRVTGSIPPPLTLERGPIARFGRFDVLGRLAVGGMADLFLVRESVEGGASRNAVIKLIRGEFSEESAFAQMFLDEGRLAMRLSHPTICTVYEVGREAGRFFMAMEFVEGQTLQRIIARAAKRKEPLPLPYLLRLFAQVAEALDFAHNARDAQGRRLNLVHRDVSPNNIMVRYDGVVKLLDFGVAKAERNQAATVSGAVKGKFSYMSPEQAMSEPVDPRSDLFSLGVCLFEAATGRRLYRRKAQYDVLKAILKEPAPSILSVRPDLPERLDEIILKLLEKDPADRYQTAADLQHDLEQLLAEQKEVVTTRTMAQRMQAMFSEEMAAGPDLDTSQAVRERFDVLLSEAGASADPARLSPAGNHRFGWFAAAGLLVVVLGLGGWIALDDGSADQGDEMSPAPQTLTAPPSPEPEGPPPADPVDPVVEEVTEPPAVPTEPAVAQEGELPAADVADPVETPSNPPEDSVDSDETTGAAGEATADTAPETGEDDAEEETSTGTTSARRGRSGRARRGRRRGRRRGGGSVIVTEVPF